MPWQSRALLPLLLRKVDRAGLIDLAGEGAEGVAAIVDLPLDVVEPGLAGLIKRGVIELRGHMLLWPRFLEGQEAVSTDAQRKRDQRERAAASARLAAIGQLVSRGVTDGHATGQIVTQPHAQSRAVTDGHSDPIRSVPSIAKPDSPARAIPGATYSIGNLDIDFRNIVQREPGDGYALGKLLELLKLWTAGQPLSEVATRYCGAYRAMADDWIQRGYQGNWGALHMADNFAKVQDWAEGKKLGPKDTPTKRDIRKGMAPIKKDW